MSAQGGTDADEIVERLVDLAREAPDEHLTPREAEGLHRLERALLRVERRGGWAVKIAAAVALVGATLGFALLRRDRVLTYVVTNGTVSEGGYIATGDTEASLRFSDRSELGVAPGTRVRVSGLQVHGARVMLEGGTLHVRIHPEPHAGWTLDAGPYVVHVTGTEFDLGWRVDDEILDLRLHKGSVILEGPLADPGVRVGAGQHLIANGTAGTLSLLNELNGNAAPSAAAAPVPAPAPSESQASPTAAAPTGAAISPRLRDTRSAMPRRGEGESWALRVAHGDFDGVIANAERDGIDKALAGSNVADLAALADAARYARRQDLARRALMAQRARYPGSVQARDASFFLGGLAENEGDDAGALEWCDVYLGENASGAYASQALGRKMMLMQKLTGGKSALSVASEYLARFPDGPYASSANKILRAQ
jgi:TolA-binding protein